MHNVIPRNERRITLRTSKHFSAKKSRQKERFRLLKDKEIRVFKELVQVVYLEDESAAWEPQWALRRMKEHDWALGAD